VRLLASAVEGDEVFLHYEVVRGAGR